MPMPQPTVVSFFYLSASVAVGGLILRAAGKRMRLSRGVVRSRACTPELQDKPSIDARERIEKQLAAPWMRSLKKALNHGGTQRKGRDRSDAKRKQVQIATVDPKTGRPSVRTVVFRGFLPQAYVNATSLEMLRQSKNMSEQSCCLCFITDDRSAKFLHLGGCEHEGAPIECCWWLDEAGVQFRIAGHTILATAQTTDPVIRAAADEVWDRLQTNTKQQFFWPHPGLRKDLASVPLDVRKGPDGEPLMEASHFALIIVVPDSVDELHLGGNQKRFLYRREGQSSSNDALEMLAALRSASWSEVVVNP